MNKPVVKVLYPTVEYDPKEHGEECPYKVQLAANSSPRWLSPGEANRLANQLTIRLKENDD